MACQFAKYFEYPRLVYVCADLALLCHRLVEILGFLRRSVMRFVIDQEAIKETNRKVDNSQCLKGAPESPYLKITFIAFGASVKTNVEGLFQKQHLPHAHLVADLQACLDPPPVPLRAFLRRIADHLNSKHSSFDFWDLL